MVFSSWLRKRCLSKYRPPTVNGSKKRLEELSDKEDGEEHKNYISAPFVPVVTSATVRECLGSTSPGMQELFNNSYFTKLLLCFWTFLTSSKNFYKLLCSRFFVLFSLGKKGHLYICILPRIFRNCVFWRNLKLIFSRKSVFRRNCLHKSASRRIFTTSAFEIQSIRIMCDFQQ